MQSGSTDNPDRKLDVLLLDQWVRIEARDKGLLRGVAACFELCFPQRDPSAVKKPTLRIRLEDGDAGEPRRFTHLATEPANALRLDRLYHPTEVFQFMTELNEWAVKNAPHHYVFHAGAVCASDRAILLPGGIHSGKTTLSAGLLQRGFELLSDEVGAIDVRSGRLVGYPRALSIRKDVFPLLGLDTSVGWAPTNSEARMVRVAEVGGKRADRPSLPVLVVIPRFSAGAANRMERLERGPALLALMEVSCSQHRFKVAGLDFVIDLVSRLPCYRLTFGHLVSAVDAIEEAFVRHTGGAA